LGVSLGSITVAVTISSASALLLRWIKRDLAHHASFEVGLIFLFGYTCYAASAALGFSGILALFTAGIFESHYHIYSLTEPGRLATAITLKALAHLVEV
jgi:NhaP-type Na+/H+ or K+/H+ antiporter